MKQWLVVFMVLGLLLPVILTACGGDGEEKTPTPTLTATPITVPTATPTATPSVTQTATPTPTPSGPVKIGAIVPWSGPMAMSGVLADQIISVVKDQVENMGGILGGRQIEFVRGDDRGVVAESIAQAEKLILDDKVTILTLGGVSAAHFTAVSEVAERLQTPYVAFASVYGVADKKFSACLYAQETTIGRVANFIIDVVKPKTVAFLGYDVESSHNVINGVEGVEGVRDRLKAKGIDIVYEQYFGTDTVDFSPYLTKIKYLNPDLVVSYVSATEHAVMINKQIMELGGWGDMKYFSGTESGGAQAAVKMPSAVGTYTVAMWLPGSNDPGMKTFEDAFKQKYGRLPTPELSMFYNCFWVAIKAIELAGTNDPVKVAEALRSGNLVWDSAWGRHRIPPNGKGEIKGMVAQVQEGGKLVKVWPQ